MSYNFSTLQEQHGRKQLRNGIIAFVALLSVTLVGVYISKKEPSPVPEETVGGVEFNVGDEVIAGQETFSAKQMEEARVLFLIELELRPAINEFNDISDEMDKLRSQGKGDSPEFSQMSSRFHRLSRALDGLLTYLGYLEAEFFSRYPEEKDNKDSPLNAQQLQAAK